MDNIKSTAGQKYLISNRSYFIMIFLFMVLICPLSANAQWFPGTLLGSPALSAADSSRLSLAVEMTGFFKDNEYFSPVAEGQTLPGASLLPAAGYQVSGRFRAEAGVYAVKYSGREPLSDVQAFIRLQYSITPEFNLVVGNLYGGVNHRLIEPLYQWDRQYTANPESGLQFVLHSSRLFADTWVDWQHYIERGDPALEMLTFGMSLEGKLIEPGRIFTLNVPLQLLIHHQGGQIDASDEPMIVLGNVAAGLCSRLKISDRWVRSVGVDVYLAGYYDRYPRRKIRPYDSGWGLYPVVHVDARPFELMAGYWYAEKFYAFEGEPLFGSFNIYDQTKRPVRNLFTFKFSYNREIFNGIHAGAQIETYSDSGRGETDFSFGVHLRFNNRFTLKQF